MVFSPALDEQDEYPDEVESSLEYAEVSYWLEDDSGLDFRLGMDSSRRFQNLSTFLGSPVLGPVQVGDGLQDGPQRGVHVLLLLGDIAEHDGDDPLASFDHLVLGLLVLEAAELAVDEVRADDQDGTAAVLHCLDDVVGDGCKERELGV